jgi:hypothetical protein
VTELFGTPQDGDEEPITACLQPESIPSATITATVNQPGTAYIGPFLAGSGSSVPWTLQDSIPEGVYDVVTVDAGDVLVRRAVECSMSESLGTISGSGSGMPIQSRSLTVTGAISTPSVISFYETQNTLSEFGLLETSIGVSPVVLSMGSAVSDVINVSTVLSPVAGDVTGVTVVSSVGSAVQSATVLGAPTSINLPAIPDVTFSPTPLELTATWTPAGSDSVATLVRQSTFITTIIATRDWLASRVDHAQLAFDATPPDYTAEWLGSGQYADQLILTSDGANGNSESVVFDTVP